jgi:hypothetical protein
VEIGDALWKREGVRTDIVARGSQTTTLYARLESLQ